MFDDDVYDDEHLDERTDWAVCCGDDCRNPRIGPFVLDGPSEMTFCYRCFATEILRIPVEEWGWVD